MSEMPANAAKSAESAPDFRHVETWIFDLDNTLYPASSDLFAQIDGKMTAYVQELTGLGWDDARKLQKTYYRDHGTTLNGLMHHHGVDPEEFLDAVHDIDLAVLTPDPDLAAAMSSRMAAAIMHRACCNGWSSKACSTRYGIFAPSTIGRSRTHTAIAAC